MRKWLLLQRRAPVPAPHLNLLPILLLGLLPCWGVASPDSDQKAALDHLNQLRGQAGMTGLSWDQRLARTAAGHAAYLARNLELSHQQQPDKPGFTGVNPGQRALQAGFDSNQVSENIHASLGEETLPPEWVDNLFTGIYHRLRFLDFHVDLVGLAKAEADFTTVVFDLSNQDQARLCSNAGPVYRSGSYYQGVCRDPARKVPAEEWEGAKAAVQLANPDWVVWPPDGAQEINPVFAEETPDPLPDLEIAGNPLSLHFNPARFESVELDAFELFAVGGDGEAEPVPARLMDGDSDPHGLLGPLDFVLFPLRRLAWNTHYRVQARYRAGTEPHRITWHFRTRDPGAPVLTLQANGETLHPPPGSRRFLVQVPEDLGVPIIRKLRYRSTQGLVVAGRIYDANSLWFELEGPRTRGLVEVLLGAGVGFRLSLQ